MSKRDISEVIDDHDHHDDDPICHLDKKRKVEKTKKTENGRVDTNVAKKIVNLTRNPKKIYKYKKEKLWMKMSTLYMSNLDQDHTRRKEYDHGDKLQEPLILHRGGTIKVAKQVVSPILFPPDVLKITDFRNMQIICNHVILDFKLIEVTRTEENDVPDFSYYEIVSGSDQMLSYSYNGNETHFSDGNRYKLFKISTKCYIDHIANPNQLSTADSNNIFFDGLKKEQKYITKGNYLKEEEVDKLLIAAYVRADSQTFESFKKDQIEINRHDYNITNGEETMYLHEVGYKKIPWDCGPFNHLSSNISNESKKVQCYLCKQKFHARFDVVFNHGMNLQGISNFLNDRNSQRNIKEMKDHCLNNDHELHWCWAKVSIPDDFVSNGRITVDEGALLVLAMFFSTDKYRYTIEFTQFKKLIDEQSRNDKDGENTKLFQSKMTLLIGGALAYIQPDMKFSRFLNKHNNEKEEKNRFLDRVKKRLHFLLQCFLNINFFNLNRELQRLHSADTNEFWFDVNFKLWNYFNLYLIQGSTFDNPFPGVRIQLDSNDKPTDDTGQITLVAKIEKEIIKKKHSKNQNNKGKDEIHSRTIKKECKVEHKLLIKQENVILGEEPLQPVGV